VFEDIADYYAKIDDPKLDVDADCIRCSELRPKGYPGFPRSAPALPEKIRRARD
jgi:dihydroxy-acid dehydratase